MIPIATDRLRLRDFRSDDLEDSLLVIGDESVTRWLSFAAKTKGEQRVLLQSAQSRAKAVPRLEYYMAACLKESDRLIGFCRLGLNGASSAKLGYAFAVAHWGQGYAQEAVAAMLTFGFAELKLHRITAAIGPDNTRSIALVTKFGFHREGILRDHVHTNGAWRDSILYSVLSEEWPSRAE